MFQNAQRLHTGQDVHYSAANFLRTVWLVLISLFLFVLDHVDSTG